ncbi:MAG: DUF1648 domain-containing protein [Eggerthella lenta]
MFTVTVPTSEQHDPYVVGLKRRYAVIVGSATAVFTVIGFASAAMGNAGGVLGALIVGSLAVTAGGYALMLAFRAKMSAYKAKRGWTADAQESVAVVGEQPVPRAISLKWNLLYLPIMAITFAVGAVGYVHMPDMIPMHMGFDGTVNDWAEKPRSSCGCRYSSRGSWPRVSCSPTGPSLVRRSGPNPARRPRRRWPTACSPARRASIWWREAW